jgi:hypothetical protein
MDTGLISILPNPAHARSILAGRQNISQAVDIILVEQTVFTEAGIAAVEVPAIEKRHEAYHEHNRDQRVVMGHKIAPSLQCAGSNRRAKVPAVRQPYWTVI